MTLTVAWWLYDQAPDNLPAKSAAAVAGIHVAGLPYHNIIKATNWLDAFNYGAHNQMVARQQFRTMVARGMPISKSSMRHFASYGVGHRGLAYALRDPMGLNRVLTKGRWLRLAGKVGARAVPGLGWALLAYDVYTVTNMILDD